MSLPKSLFFKKNRKGLKLLGFSIIFAAIGTYLIQQSFAATVTLATIEAEAMAAPAAAQITADSTASAGKFLAINANGEASGQVNLRLAANQIVVRAKGVQCQGAPQMIVKVDGAVKQTHSVSATTWTDYPTAVSVPAGAHTISVGFTNDYNQYKKGSNRLQCSRDLHVDKVVVYGEEEITDPGVVTELASGKPATASSVEGSGYEAPKANDGSTATRWASQYADNQWWQTDLGAAKLISKVDINWEAAYASRYLIQISGDGTNFTTVADVSNSQAGLKSTSFSETSARYVRIMGLTRGTAYGFSIWEAQVFGKTGGTNPPPSSVKLPIAPQSYTLPASYVTVTSSQALVTALASSTPQSIVIANGTYSTVGTSSTTPYFRVATGHKVYAQNVGGAILTAGISFGGNFGSGGGELRGVAFNITDPTRVHQDTAVYNWGPAGAGTKVYDVTVEGNYAINKGIYFYQVQDTVVQRTIVKHVKKLGVVVTDCCDDNWFDNTATASTITDIDVYGVSMNTSSNDTALHDDGKSEMGFWVGNKVINPVERIKSEQAWWSGIWAGSSSRDTVFRDLSVSGTGRPDGVGIYNEHKTISNIYEKFQIGPNLKHGIICEWNYGTAGNTGACDKNTFQDGVVDTREYGVYLDWGAVGNTLQRIVFKNQSCAAILENQSPNNTYLNNDFTGIKPTAQQVALNEC